MSSMPDSGHDRADEIINRLPEALGDERLTVLQQFATEMSVNDFPIPDLLEATKYANTTLCCPALSIEQVGLAVALATNTPLSSEDAAKILTPAPLTIEQEMAVEQVRRDIALGTLRASLSSEDAAKPEPPDPNSDAHSVKEPAGALPFKLARDIAPLLDQNALVEGLLSPGALSLWYGPSNIGKSFVMLDLAAHIALGRDWFSRKTQQGAVLYIAAESGVAIFNRIAAIKKHYGVTDFPLLVCSEPINLCGQANAHDTIIDAIRKGSDIAGCPIVLVVIDTLNASFGGGDENNTQHMTVFKNRCLSIKAKTEAHVAVVHHPGKDVTKGARGNGSMYNAVDSAFEFKDGKVLNKKQRDMEIAKPFGFALTTVTVGTKATGEVVTSCVVGPASLRARQDFELKPPKGQAAVALEMLHNITLGGQGATLNEWRDACRDKLTKGSGQRTVDVAFRRAMKKLQDHITFTSGRYLPAAE